MTRHDFKHKIRYGPSCLSNTWKKLVPFVAVLYFLFMLILFNGMADTLPEVSVESGGVNMMLCTKKMKLLKLL